MKTMLKLVILCGLAFIIGAEDEKWSSDYCFISEDHVLCNKNEGAPYPECPKNVSLYELGKSKQQEILTILNEFRSRMAKGKLKHDKNGPVANMMEMKWDDELALAAMNIASRCNYYHPCPDCLQLDRFPITFIQEMIFYPSSYSDRLPWKTYLHRFFMKDKNEIRVRINNNAIPLDAPIIPRDHMLWAETYLVGCNLAIFLKDVSWVHNVVCAFGPTGPEPEKQMYKSGSPCTDCPPGSDCSETNKVLCEYKDICHRPRSLVRVRRQGPTTVASMVSGSMTGMSTVSTPTGSMTTAGNIGAATTAGGMSAAQEKTDAPTSAPHEAGDADDKSDSPDTAVGEVTTESSDAKHSMTFAHSLHIFYALSVALALKF